jgi:hypothetical protein
MKTKIIRKLFSSFAVFSALALFAFALAPSSHGGAKAHTAVRNPRLGRSNFMSSVKKGDVEATLKQMTVDPSSTLPLWMFDVRSTRDFNFYAGVIVGANPFTERGIKTNLSVPTFVVPLIIVTNSIVTSVDPITGNITGAPGVTVFNPTVDDACLAAPNNVPTTLFAQSPILRPAGFGFVGGNGTQYVDAFQRANFWEVINSNPLNNHYHVLLHPVTLLAPIVINVPAPNGFAGTTPFIFPPPDAPICPPFGTVDMAWFDNFLQTTVIPGLAAQGVNPSTLPIFLVHNVGFASPPVTNFFNWGIGGYHGAVGGAPIQSYVVGDFDTSDFFMSDGFHDTGVFSHEVAEWMNDPFVGVYNNLTPGWINAGGGCQGNYEVGDFLGDLGFQYPPVRMPNGFTYHLQELNFFSWFYGAPSIGVNGWFSNNGTSLTDAGPPCP